MGPNKNQSKILRDNVDYTEFVEENQEKW